VCIAANGGIAKHQHRAAVWFELIWLAAHACFTLCLSRVIHSSFHVMPVTKIGTTDCISWTCTTRQPCMLQGNKYYSRKVRGKATPVLQAMALQVYDKLVTIASPWTA